ncbi:hypothetical protein [Nitrosomonas ureae]|uniref:Uncharacterized protein n=1 Tax=Nitrosomonas ureae TaxID=44577 RepID=A0A2T5ISN4_9PROT|nr:hypothetical protein [Nitrosomonas ureae]PTQ86861.1 hypothetical protein C8R28_100856 [Nitrosomonas ureae]
MNQASSLSIYSHTSFAEALSMPCSVVNKFFNGKPFEDWKKGKESEMKIQIAIVNRLNSVISACGVVAKTIASVIRR